MNTQTLLRQIEFAKSKNHDARNKISSSKNFFLNRKITDNNLGRDLSPGDSRPFAYFEARPTPFPSSLLGGIGYGAGLFGHLSEDGKDRINMIFFTSDSGFFEENGNTRFGQKSEGGIFSANIGNDLFDCNFLTYSVEASAGTDGLTIGGNLSLIDAAFGFGNKDENSDGNWESRVGGGVTAGAQIRLHWDDEDGDGKREFGIGVDAGPFSLDHKEEGLFWGFG